MKEVPATMVLSSKTERLFKFSGPFSASLYIAFGLMDLILSLAAFALGIPEGNPVLAYMEQQGLFLPAKVILTILVAILIAFLHHHKSVRPVAYSAILIMAFVDAYHVWALSALLPTG
jgi:hypothetical protein